MTPCESWPTRLAPTMWRMTSAASSAGVPAATNSARPISSRRSAGIFGISRSSLPVDLVHDFRPPVDDRQHRIRLLRREHRHHARDAHLSEALHPVKILAEAEQADFEGGWIASGFPYHLAEFRQGLGDIAT